MREKRKPIVELSNNQRCFDFFLNILILKTFLRTDRQTFGQEKRLAVAGKWDEAYCQAQPQLNSTSTQTKAEVSLIST